MYRKEIIVLSGGANKAVVKLTTSLNGKIKGNCRTEFKPKDSMLYILGENCYEIKLQGYETSFEIPDDGSEYACVLLSDFPPMFGTGKAHILRNDAILRAEMFRKNLMQGHNSVNKAENINFEPSFRETSSNNIEKPVDENYCDKQKNHSDDKTEQIGDKADKNFAKESLNKNRYKKEGLEEKTSQNANYKKGSTFAKDENVKHSQTDERETVMDVMENSTQYEGDNFYYAVKPQLDEMFVRYPEDVELDTAIPNSRWIRVDTKDDFYVVGILYDDGEPVYICYGIPGKYSEKPSASLSDVCVWLSLDGVEQKTAEDGYWVIYQSAKDGKIVK